MSDTSGLFSVRMRAASGARHLSGAERLVPFPGISTVVQKFLDRAWSKGIPPDEVVLTVEPLGDRCVHKIQALDLLDLREEGVSRCRDAASGILRSAGVAPQAVQQAFSFLDRGPSEAGGAMRGAMVMDALTGERLEPDRSRGVRASRFDWSDDAFLSLSEQLARLGLTHFRTHEALALASKISFVPGFVAELCWSDDPDYRAGYVASRPSGYVRLPFMKEEDGSSGGRAVFIDTKQTDIGIVTEYLERQPVIVTAIGKCRTEGTGAAALTVS